MAYNIMIQGTMSGAGKSLITAGLLRILSQDGYQCAPFKSQNMALNSYITSEGLEMGRAQVMQAYAAGIRPTADMNPILLKPTTDSGSQVIAGGRPVGTMDAAAYYRRKPEFVPRIMESYGRLDDAFDVIVIEGAGSPAEINLKENDIVNMGLAKMVDAPVLLVGDIDRGGVFAQLFGTWALLDQEEKARIKGMIINKFRGDEKLLRPGYDLFAQHCPVPILGTVPMMHIDLDEEDSLSERLSSSPLKARSGTVDIAVIRLPRISNYTDFAPLERLENTTVRYVDNYFHLQKPDLIILPGTKNTLDDLRWLRRTGFADRILALHAQGTPVVGICGGYQMMGRTVTDPDGNEGGGTEAGLGLLPVDTVFRADKTTRESSGTACAPDFLTGLPVKGYEIHMGESVRTGGQPFCRLRTGSDAGSDDGALHEDGCVANGAMGTYLHGLFDTAAFTQRFADALARRSGLDTAGQAQDADLYEQKQFDLLADTLRRSLDMERIRRIIFRRES